MEHVNFSEKRQSIQLTYGICLLIVLGVAGVFGTTLVVENVRISTLSRTIREKKSELQTNQQAIQLRRTTADLAMTQNDEKINFIKTKMQERVTWATYIKWIGNAKGETIWLNHFAGQVDETGKRNLTINGVSHDSTSIMEFITTLTKSRMFKNVNLGSLDQKKDNEKGLNYYDFVIQCVL